MQFGKVCISINQKNISPALGSYLVEQLQFERYANVKIQGLRHIMITGHRFQKLSDFLVY